jgi:Fe-S oxidoreductase
LPVSYLLLIAFPTSRAAAIDEQLNSIVDTAGGTFLPQATAEHEWVGRTAPMRLKRIGPSIIPTEVTVPLSELASTLAEIDSTTKQSLIIEGMSGKGGQVTLLGFIPHDERSFAFNFAFALALSVIQIAKRHQGSAYSTGLYFRSEAQTVLGHEHLTRLQAFKQEVDPANLINPGKVLRIGRGGRVLDALMGIAKALEPLIRPIANAAKAPLPYTVANAARSQLPNGATHSPLPSAANTEHERQRIARSRSLHKVPAEVAYMAIACARCGYCVPTCEQFSVRGWESQSPRGKYAYLREVIAGREKWDRKAIDTFLLCTTCERCNLRCQLHLPVEHNNMLMRGSLIQEEGMGTFPPFEMMAASLRGEGDIWAGKRQHRADWLPEDVATRLTSGNDADILYFAGCTSSYVETDIAEATIRLLLDSGLKVAYLGTQENCCGIPMKMAGKWDLFSQIYADNVALVKQTGAHTIVTSCAACGLVWKELYAEEAAKRGESYDIVSKHYSEIIAPALMDGRIRLTNNPLGGKRVTFHDSCHAGRAQGIYEEPRQMLAAIPGLDIIEMEHNRDQGICCGSVLTLVGDIDKAPCLGKQRLDEAMDIDADTIISLCPCCQVQLRDSVDKHDLPLVIDDLARIVAAAAGYDIPSSAPQTSYMWGLFDVFIRLMAPAEMARFMQRIFPDMIDAMPLKMGPMMRVMIKLPGGAAMMRKMMPLLFPIMAPGILAKVMPRMIEEVQAYVGKMPPDMDELMPELLPKTLDALMPTYLPQLIPYLVPLFIGHLQGKAPIAVKRIPSGSDPLPPDKSLVADDDPLVEKPKVA